MAESETEAEHKQRFMRRVKEARIARALKQWEIAEAIGIPQDQYKQYETRSYMPPYLYGRFCTVCRVDPGWLVTGRGKMVPPEKPAPDEPAKPVQVPSAKPRRRRAA